MRNHATRSFVIAFLICFAQLAGHAQVEERNVRAGMYFLAGDALQGRGSGTVFERIAAEYVGSQFMQFGLEPAGDLGFDGKPTFVQTVTIKRYAFDGQPSLKAGADAFGHGKEMVVLRANAGSISGPLQKLAAGAKPNKGAAVLVPAPKDGAVNLNQYLQSFIAAGASIVMIEETEQHRAAWQNLASRRLGFTGNAANPSALVVLSKDAAAGIAKLADGAAIEFAGKTAETTQQTWNAAGKLTGSDPALGSEVILLSSHLDHLGVRENAPGDDKIFNGADDDASGTVAVIELARTFASGKRPKRTVYFVCFGSEEAGGLGSNHFVNNLPFPKEKLIANLQWEMIGRPDAKVKPDELWLTGFERSNLGPELAKRGAKLVQDPHPGQNFFQRSDNYTLARQGVVAHTVSSFGLHTDYHRASDELKTIDFGYMTRSVNSMVEPIRWLVNSDFKPSWNEGMRP
ncbi:MAG: M20/M25/M40 family metallo-hydrolase [Pyrinomonadaceae bacterium]